MWDACRVPFVPELFSAPALARLEDKWRPDELVAVPYFDGLMAGEPDALVGLFAAEPELHDPVRGRVKGTRAFKAFVTDLNGWIARRNVTVENVEHVVSERRGFEEVVLHLDGETGRVDLPLAIVADREADGRIDELRIYSSTWPLTGRHANRPPLLQPDPELRESDVVAEYQRALAAVDVEAIVAAFGPTGSPASRRAASTSTEARTTCAPSISCCSRTTAASHWNVARSSTTGARARWSTTSCGGARRSCRRKPGSLSTFGVRAVSSRRSASTMMPTPRLVPVARPSGSMRQCPAAWPPSTCRVSPVTNVARSR